MDNQDLTELWGSVFQDDEIEKSPLITKSRYYEIDELASVMKSIE